QGYSKFECRFTHIPTVAGGLPKGAILGGTGLAISSKCQNPQAAADYARYVAHSDCQRGLYFESGGQPGNITAWLDPSVNLASSDFFADTLDTLTHAYMRPRYPGYIHFQTQASLIVHEFLRHGGNPLRVLEDLNRLHLETTQSTPLSKGTQVK